MICCWFCRTARAAWARWLRLVYRRSVWEKERTVLSFTLVISAGQSAMAAVSQDSRDLAKFLMA